MFFNTLDQIRYTTVFSKLSYNHKIYIIQLLRSNSEKLSQSVAQGLKQNLEGKYSNLRSMQSWAILVGYDGYRKNTYQSTNVNDFVPGMFRQIDGMPMRREEMAQQQRKGITCDQNSFMTSGV